MRLPPVLFASAAAAWIAACAPNRPAAEARRGAPDGRRDSIDIDSVPGDTAFDRAAFGQSPLPVWSGLTAPEIEALQGRARAAAGDNRAMLRLAIFASGDRRSDSDYAAILARFEAFVARERPLLGKYKDPDRKADRLLRDMHAGFFKRGTVASGPQPGYDYDQSALTGIFADGRFNCVSSAILYVLLAREFGFAAQGAVMPRHAYAHLVFPNGRSAEVETTTPDGYERAHAGSEAPKRPRYWYSDRGLDPGMALDYAQRRLVEPLELIGFNMRNQHILALPLVDRYRLLEAAAWVSPGDAQAQADRVAVWELEYQYLSGRGRWDMAHRLFTVTAPLLPEAHASLGADPLRGDHPAWLASARARAGAEAGDPQKAAADCDTALAWIPAGGDAAGAIRANVMGALMRISQRWVEAGRFPQTEKLLLDHPGYLKDSAEYRGNLAWAYANWAHAAWKKSDWPAAIERLEKALAYARPGDTASVERDLAAAYFNRALAYRERGDRGKALEVLRRCRNRLPRAKTCREIW